MITYKRKYDINKAVRVKKWPPIWANWLHKMTAREADVVIRAACGYIPGLTDRRQFLRMVERDGSAHARDIAERILDHMDNVHSNGMFAR